MKPITAHNFAENSQRKLPRSSIAQPWDHKTTFDTDYLYPVYHAYMYPGDELKVKTSMYARLATPYWPIMDNLYLKMHYFKIPLRQVWENFRRFYGEVKSPGDSIDYETPILELTGDQIDECTLWDYFGVPTKVQDLEFHAFLHRAYAHVWNWWYRAENWQDAVTVDVDDGPDDIADYGLLKINKYWDYFTAMNPTPQIGDEVTIGIGTTAAVYGTGQNMLISDGESVAGTFQNSTFNLGGALNAVNQNIGAAITPTGQLAMDDVIGLATQAEAEASMQGDTGIYADLTDATAVSINDLYEAAALQRLAELRARTGRHYNEIIMAEFGVHFNDIDEMPEYIGGDKQRINIHQVIQQSESSVDSPQGAATAYIDIFQQSGFTAYATEPCLVLGMASVTADITYQDGLDRNLTWRTKDELYTPLMADLCDQEVLMQEIYVGGNPANWENVIGYIGRWDHLRFRRSIVTGQMRSNHTTPLHAWHLAEQFTSEPDFSTGSLESNVPIARTLVQGSSENCVIAHFNFDEYVTRQMPVKAIPGRISFL